jgi:hypothetical protein
MNIKLLLNQHIGNTDAAEGGYLCLYPNPNFHISINTQNLSYMQSSLVKKLKKSTVQSILKVLVMFILAAMTAGTAAAQAAKQSASVDLKKNADNTWGLVVRSGGKQVYEITKEPGKNKGFATARAATTAAVSIEKGLAQQPAAITHLTDKKITELYNAGAHSKNNPVKN